MGLKEHNWESYYDSKINNITTEFFIPALSEATVYRRIAGLFSSTNFALCARGLKELISNYGHMQLIVSPIFTKDDIDAIEDIKNLDPLIEKSIEIELNQIEDGFEKNHIDALKFLLKHNFLEIRLDIPKDSVGKPLDKESIIKSTILSEKRGIFQDRDGNVLSFRGPVNESKESWEKGIFQITVDSNWIEGQKQHVIDDIRIFEEKWNHQNTIPLPMGIKRKLIMTSPKEQEIDLSKYDYPSWVKIPNDGNLWPHQIRAVNSWIKNNYKGIFTMATGSGKTLSALSAVNLGTKNQLVLIIAYGKSLVKQWQKEIKKFDQNSDVLICDSSTEWKRIIPGKLIPYIQGNENSRFEKRLYIITTPQTASMDYFYENFKNIPEENMQLVADEVHHLGAEEFSKVFLLNCSRRLGLSATYRRDWDEPGTQAILNYFEKALDEAKYGLSDAIKDGRLCRYRYFPYFAYLDSQEFDKYVDISLKIRKKFVLMGIDENSTNMPVLPKNLHQDLIKRARIIKKCQDKIRVFMDIIEDSPKKPFIVFADDKIQAYELKKAYTNKIREINKHKSTEMLNDDIMLFDGEKDDSERQEIITTAKSRSIPLIGMYCLDEGIDIPELQSAIIVASSSSKRQYIQRRGRILRLGNRNKTAELYDIIVIPKYHPEQTRSEIAKSIILKEKDRIRELSEDADNKNSVELKVYEEIKKNGFEFII